MDGPARRCISHGLPYNIFDERIKQYEKLKIGHQNHRDGIDYPGIDDYLVPFL
jgi:hypothetical protein